MHKRKQRVLDMERKRSSTLESHHQASPVEHDALLSYNSLPFEGRAHRETHPARLGAAVRLYGVRPPPIETARVLDLGCGSGDNLIGMASSLPNATFVGIDVSDRQIALGRKIIDALGLANVTLEPIGILEITPDLGKFDYIVAHGVYSWVPGPVRERLLEVIASSLAPAGVGYVCYNTLPGWRFRGAVRDLLRTLVRPGTPPPQAARFARNALERLAEAPLPNALFAEAVAREVALFRDLPDSYLFHELLETDNEPVYFKTFLEQAGRAGLAYVTDTESFVPLLDNLDDTLATWICEQADDRYDMEQLLDFLYARTFRRSILVHDDVHVASRPDPTAVQDLHAAGRPALETRELRLEPSETAHFSGGGKRLGVRHPVSKLALLELAAAWPEALTFPDLSARTARRLAEFPGQSFSKQEIADVLALTLQTGMETGVLDLLSHPFSATARIGSHPRSSPLARYQVSAGRRFVTNLHHDEILLQPFDRILLSLADGTRNLDTLCAALHKQATPSLHNDEHPDHPSDPRTLCASALMRLRNEALLLPQPETRGKIR